MTVTPEQIEALAASHQGPIADTAREIASWAPVGSKGNIYVASKFRIASYAARITELEAIIAGEPDRMREAVERCAMVEALRNIAGWSDSAVQHPSCAIDMRNTARAALAAIGGGDDPAAGAGEGG